VNKDVYIYWCADDIDRCACWAWQPSELSWRDWRRHGSGHRVVGQLPQDLELATFVASSSPHSELASRHRHHRHSVRRAPCRPDFSYQWGMSEPTTLGRSLQGHSVASRSSVVASNYSATVDRSSLLCLFHSSPCFVCSNCLLTYLLGRAAQRRLQPARQLVGADLTVNVTYSLYWLFLCTWAP